MRKERTPITRDQALKANIFFGHGTQDYNLVVGDHSIEDVLPASDAETTRFVSGYCPQRGTHIPIPSKELLHKNGHPPKSRMGLIIANGSADIREAVTEHIKYINTLTPYPIEVFDPTKIRKQSSLLVPYINTQEAHTRFSELGAHVFGLPGEMTDTLKNKAESHFLLQNEYQSETLRVADFTIAEVQDVPTTAYSFLGEMEEMYKEVGLYEHYKNKLGIVLRAAQSDGNYGNVIVRIEGNTVLVIKDGDRKNALEIAGTGESHWKKALTHAQNYLNKTMNNEKENRVVISRYADIVDSPGMTTSLIDGHVISWGWNGQLMKEGSKACIGTSTYEPKNQYCADIQKEFEPQMEGEYAVFLQWLAEKYGQNFSKLRAITNIDLMIPSPLEFELQRRRGQKRHLILAEFNPRLSEFSDPVVGKTLFYPELKQTTETFRKINRDGVYTFAKWELPQKIDPRKVRNELQMMFADGTPSSFYGKRGGHLVAVRIAPEPPKDTTHENTMGFVIYGNRTRGEEAVNKAIQKVAIT